MKIRVARSVDTAVETELELEQIKRASPTRDAVELEVSATRRRILESAQIDANHQPTVALFARQGGESRSRRRRR
jgi:hypothetical protein